MPDNCITISLDLPDLVVLGQEETESAIIIRVCYRTSRAVCPQCGHSTPKIHDRTWQDKRDLPLQHKKTILRICKRRFHCPFCAKIFTESDNVFGWRRRSTHRLRQYLHQEAQHQTVRHLATTCALSEGFVRRSFQEEAPLLQRETPVVMGIDEFSVKRGQRYETVFADLAAHQILEVIPGRSAEAVQGYLEQLPTPEKVQVVVIDMSSAFRAAVELCLPAAHIVVDKFHAIRLVNEALDALRIRLQRASKEGTKGALYKHRYLLLRKREELKDEEMVVLEALFKRYPELRQGWLLKEDFRRWYKTAGQGDARLELAAWEAMVREQGPAEFQECLPAIAAWREEILNYFTWHYTNGFVEGKNNRTKAIQRQAYGYRNRENLRLRILLPATP